MLNKTIGFIGGGRVAQIILGGLQRAGKMPRQIVVSDPSFEVLGQLKEKFPEIGISPNDNKQPALQDLVFLAVHPPALDGVLGQIKPYLKPNAILISLAPRFTIAKMSEALGGFTRIMRTIPNAPSVVNAGYNPVAFSPVLTETEKMGLLHMFSALGACPQVAEKKLEAYAILTAMGPTYLWFQLYELADLGESFHLTRAEVADGLAAMAMGAVKTMYESGLSATEVMDLIPVKPLGEDEPIIKNMYRTKLISLFGKLTG